MGHCKLPIPPTPPFNVPAADSADKIWGAAAMERARHNMRREHGGGSFSQVTFNIAEVSLRNGRDGYRWDTEGWFGGDLNRVTIKSEGAGAFGQALEHAELQALYSRAIGPYFDLQAGVRQDIGPRPHRTYAVLGVEGLAPYWFDIEAALFLSTKGDLLARVEGYYDQRITQRLILQPSAELNISAQDIPELHTASGITDTALALRLRYELARELAPYVGVAWERKLGGTARIARDRGEGTGGAELVVGIRTWF